MKYLQYQLLQSVREDGSPILLEKSISWSEENTQIARQEAYGGEYVVLELEQPQEMHN